MKLHTLRSTAAIVSLAVLSSASLTGRIRLEKRSTIITGDPVAIFDESAAEIVAFDARSQRLFIVNGATDAIDVVNISDIAHPLPVTSIDLTPFGSPNSVAVNPNWFRGEIAVAVANPVKTGNGWVLFFDTDGNLLNQIEVGALPDMVTYDHFGFRLLVANEGEPDDDYLVDPPGSVSVIFNFWGAAHIQPWQVKTIGFADINPTELPESVRIFGPGASVAQDFEPEYIALDAKGRKAWVTLQENNAIAVVDLWRLRVERVIGLGTIDHTAPGFGLDPSDKDDGINIANWPVCGFPMPDAIASFKIRGRNYFITANEGDSRDYDGFSEEARVKDLVLDPTAFPDASSLQKNEKLGRLNVTTVNGDVDGDGDFDKLYSFGTRSFSIWDERGRLCFDSGDELEQITAALLPNEFNSNNDENDSFESRSDNKGPEPEGVVTGRIRGRTYAFVGLERIGGIMVYDVSNPYNPEFIEYVNNRDFSGDAEAGTAGDLGPEGILFIEAHRSPSRTPLLVVANEVSGTTTVFEIISRR